MLTAQIAASPTPALTRTIAQTLTDLTTSVLHKDAAVVSVAVEYVDPSQWFSANASLSDTDSRAFFVSIRVTDGTNTKDDIAEFVRRVFDSLDQVLGGVHPASYVHVDGVRADSYGFGGRTAEHRYIAARLAAPV